MGKKRSIYSSEAKHRWHLSYNKVKRLNRLFDMIASEHGITEDAGIHANQVAGRYADNKILKKEGNTNGLHKS